MSYSLLFWNAAPTHDPGQVWDQLEDGHQLPNVQSVDATAVEQALVAELRGGWERVSQWMWAFEPDSDGNGPAADVSVRPRYISVSCYGLEGAQMNQFIDALFPLGYRLYDPQTNERFD